MDRGGSCLDGNMSEVEVVRGDFYVENELCGPNSLVDEIESRASESIISSRAILSPRGFMLW